MQLFEKLLRLSIEDIELELRGQYQIPWADFILNPRRLRGSDFLMRWSQGVWSEDRIVHMVNETGKYMALPYGPSGTAPDNDIRAFELYFERLEKAGLGKLKRPDILIFRKAEENTINEIIKGIGGVQELPFTTEEDANMKKLLRRAIIAVECENSLWQVSKMPDYGSELKPQSRLGGKLGLKKSAVLPTVIIKEEDRIPLRKWQNQHGISIHIWHIFYDMAFGISLDTTEKLIKDGSIEPTVQTFQAPGGATTKKTIFKIYYQHAYPLGTSEEEPKLIPHYINDKNGHILPYVRFEGGSLKIAPEALKELSKAENKNAN